MSACDSGLLPLSLPSISVVSSFGRGAALEGQDFVFSMPPNWPTSTPVPYRKRASWKCSAGSGAGASARVDPSLAATGIEVTRHMETRARGGRTKVQFYLAVLKVLRTTPPSSLKSISRYPTNESDMVLLYCNARHTQHATLNRVRGLTMIGVRTRKK